MTVFLNTSFVYQANNIMYPENPEETQVIVGSMNMGYDIYPAQRYPYATLVQFRDSGTRHTVRDSGAIT